MEPITKLTWMANSNDHKEGLTSELLSCGAVTKICWSIRVNRPGGNFSTCETFTAQPLLWLLEWIWYRKKSRLWHHQHAFNTTSTQGKRLKRIKRLKFRRGSALRTSDLETQWTLKLPCLTCNRGQVFIFINLFFFSFRFFNFTSKPPELHKLFWYKLKSVWFAERHTHSFVKST